mgnify:CR=1 FL=1
MCAVFWLHIAAISIHASRVGGDLHCGRGLRILTGISIHASRVGGDAPSLCSSSIIFAFQSTPPEWEATPIGHAAIYGLAFQSTPPEWEATFAVIFPAVKDSVFQSTPPEWEATLSLSASHAHKRISIHASRVGGDSNIRTAAPAPAISIHASRVGGDDISQAATIAMWISIHASRVGGDAVVALLKIQAAEISIHASRVGGDEREARVLSLLADFNPRLPSGRRPARVGARQTASEISIHASRVGGDACGCRKILRADFNPRLPSGRRHAGKREQFDVNIFQSTPPEWEATAKIYEEWSDSLEFLLNSPRGCS